MNEKQVFVNLCDAIKEQKAVMSTDAIYMAENWYNSTAYIQDAITEEADSRVDIYMSDLWEFARGNEEYIERAVNDGLVDMKHFDVYNLLSVAEFLYIEEELYKEEEDIKKLSGLLLASENGAKIKAEDLDIFLDDCGGFPVDRFDELEDVIAKYDATEEEEEEGEEVEQ